MSVNLFLPNTYAQLSLKYIWYLKETRLHEMPTFSCLAFMLLLWLHCFLSCWPGTCMHIRNYSCTCSMPVSVSEGFKAHHGCQADIWRHVYLASFQTAPQALVHSELLTLIKYVHHKSNFPCWRLVPDQWLWRYYRHRIIMAARHLALSKGGQQW